MAFRGSVLLGIEHGHPHLEVDGGARDVGYLVSGERLVGHEDEGVGSHVVKAGHAQAHTLNSIGVAGKSDEVVLLEGGVDHEVDAAEDVGEGLLESEADYQAEDTNAGSQDADVDAQVLQNEDEGEDEEDERADGAQEGDNEVVNPAVGVGCMSS